MQTSPFVCLSALALATSAAPLLAGGYQITEKNARGLGRAYAGEAALGEDASALGNNPAAMSRLKRPSFSASLAVLDADLKVEVAESNIVIPALAAQGLPKIKNSGKLEASAGPDRPLIPALYAVYPLSESYALGLGVFSNFASETKYQGDFAGRILAEESKVTATNINPSVSVKITPTLALGFGFNAVYTEAKLSSANPSVSPFFVQPGVLATFPGSGEAIVIPNGNSLGSSEIQGDSWGFGWNTGILWQASEETRVGLSYRSQVRAELEGDTRFKQTPNVDAFTDFAARAPLELPEIYSLSVVQKLPYELQFSADLSETRWSNFKDLSIFRKDTDIVVSRVDERWEDALRYSAGLDYAGFGELTLRTGFAYDESPIPNERRTLRIPTGDLRFYSVGASYAVNAQASVDFGYSLVRQTVTGIQDKREFIDRPFYAETIARSTVNGQIFATQLNVSL